MRYAINAMDQVRMNLPQRNQRPWLAAVGDAEFAEKQFAIAFDRRARILLREPEVERAATISARDSAHPS